MMNPVYQIEALRAAQDSSREILFRTICIPNTGEGEGGFFNYGGKNEQGKESTSDYGGGIGSIPYLEESKWN
jgi:hypothetical protein